jgi:hypothetical protein
MQIPIPEAWLKADRLAGYCGGQYDGASRGRDLQGSRYNWEPRRRARLPILPARVLHLARIASKARYGGS